MAFKNPQKGENDFVAISYTTRGMLKYHLATDDVGTLTIKRVLVSVDFNSPMDLMEQFR